MKCSCSTSGMKNGNWSVLGCMLPYLISMYQSRLPSGYNFSIDEASDLAGMKSIVHMYNCDHVPLKKKHSDQFLNLLKIISWNVHCQFKINQKKVKSQHKWCTSYIVCRDIFQFRTLFIQIILEIKGVKNVFFILPFEDEIQT